MPPARGHRPSLAMRCGLDRPRSAHPWPLVRPAGLSTGHPSGAHPHGNQDTARRLYQKPPHPKKVRGLCFCGPLSHGKAPCPRQEGTGHPWRCAAASISPGAPIPGRSFAPLGCPPDTPAALTPMETRTLPGAYTKSPRTPKRCGGFAFAAPFPFLAISAMLTRVQTGLDAGHYHAR